jgi:hypothetical protein
VRLSPSDVAGRAVRFATEEFGINLDYSLDSLGRVDALLKGLAARGYAQTERLEIGWMFGVYCGEVLVRQGAAEWRAIAGDPKLEQRFDSRLGFVLALQGPLADRVGKAWDELKDGLRDSLFDLAVPVASQGGELGASSKLPT